MPWGNGGTGWAARSGWEAPVSGGGGGGAFLTWDPNDFVVADKFGNARVTLDATKLIATEFNASGGAVVIGANHPINSAKVRFEITPNTTGVSIGLELAAHKTDGAGAGLFGQSMEWLPDGRVFVGFSLMATVDTYSPGDHCGIEIDRPNNLARFVVNGGSVLPAPGVDISSLSGALYPAANLGPTNGNNATINGAAPWNTTVTAGYGAIS